MKSLFLALFLQGSKNFGQELDAALFNTNAARHLLISPAHRKATTANFVKAKKSIHFMRLHELYGSGLR